MSEVSHNEWMEMVKNVNRGMVNTRMAKAIIEGDYRLYKRESEED
ncbi:hypothetical protein R7M47_17955 [Bacillus inaquosorum]